MFKVTSFLILTINLQTISIPQTPQNVVPDLDVALYFESEFAYLYVHKRRRGFLSIGFGSGFMADSNVLILNKIDNGNDIILRDCWSYGRFPFDCRQTPLFEIVQKDINPDKLEVLLRRRITVTEPLTANFSTTEPNSFIYNFTDREVIEFHYGPTCIYGSFQIFNNNIVETERREVRAIPGGIQHAFQNIVIWIFIVDILIIFVKFFKIVKFYHIIHGLLLTIVCVYTFIIIGTIWSERVVSGRNYPPHFIASIPILIFTILEFFTGIFLSLKIQFNLGKLNVMISKKTSRYIHGILGFLCWIAVRVGSFYGTLYLFALYDIIVYYHILIAETVVFLVCFVTLFILYIFNKKIFKIKLNQNKKLNNNVDRIKNSNYFDLIKNKSNEIFVFYKNRIYDINKIIHPGGTYIFDHLKYRDVTRFLFGSYGLELNNSENWLHTNFAFSLLEKHFIGKLNIEYEFIKNSQNNINYKLYSVEKLNNNWNIYYFKNEKVKVGNYITKLSEISTYFNIKNSVDTFRNYTTIMSATKYNRNLNETLLNYIENLISNQSSEFNFKKEDHETNLLPFVIKSYKSKIGVSQYLSNLKIGNETQIEGPYGEGIYLDNIDSLTLITGGTGILPVYDLIDLIFKKICLKYLESKNINLNIEELELGNKIKDIKITLIASFISDKEFFGIPYLNMISKIQKILNINLIDINIRFSKKPENEYEFNLFEKRINKEFLLDKIQNRNEKIYICGPPHLNNSVFNLLNQNLYHNIYLV